MKTERYISLLAVLVIGLFLVNASWPEAALAEVKAPTVPTCFQANAPVNTWCVPATSGAGVTGTFCSNVPAPVPARSASPVTTYSETPWEVLGSILAVPFVAGQCILAGCP